MAGFPLPRLLVLGLVACGETGAREQASASAEAAASATATASASASASATASAPEGPNLEPEPTGDDMPEATLAEQRTSLLARMRAAGMATEAQTRELLAIMETSKMTGQGNPVSTTHPLTRKQCVERRRAAGVRDQREPRCGAPYMVPVYEASADKASARLCIDRYEFPGLPCEYPLTWVTTAQAQKICKVLGKRLCDAHEWEGACAADLRPAKEEYRLLAPRLSSSSAHNFERKIVWAYGPEKDHAKCGTMSAKSPGCNASQWKECGSNTYPTGSFPECRSPFGVYDQHGNAAEHMLLPLRAEDLGVRGGQGVPEMKGSWFTFSIKEAHLDDCRWRAPSWHDNEGMNHANYHLGFRCCKDIDAPP